MPDNLNADGNSAVFEVFFDDLEYIRDTLNWIKTLKRRPTPIQFERTRAGEYPWVNMDARGMGRPEFIRMPNYTEHPFTILLDVWVFAGERDPEAIIYRNPDTPTLTEGIADLCDQLVNRLMTQFHERKCERFAGVVGAEGSRLSVGIGLYRQCHDYP
jgi:hypothetical protein